MVIAADESFPLITNMRAFPGKNLTDEQRIFNYRLSRARRISENVFGILVQKFRIFMRPLQGNSENITRIVLTPCILYNFIRNNEDYKVPELTDDSIRRDIYKTFIVAGEEKTAKRLIWGNNLNNSSISQRVVWSGKKVGPSWFDSFDDISYRRLFELIIFIIE